jgi:hypothetical protein
MSEFVEYQARAAAVGVTLTQMASGEYRLQQPRSDWPIVTPDWSFVIGWIARREREQAARQPAVVQARMELP